MWPKGAWFLYTIFGLLVGLNRLPCCSAGDNKEKTDVAHGQMRMYTRLVGEGLLGYADQCKWRSLSSLAKHQAWKDAKAAAVITTSSYW
jgi:hypothetical protein